VKKGLRIKYVQRSPAAAGPPSPHRHSTGGEEGGPHHARTQVGGWGSGEEGRGGGLQTGGMARNMKAIAT
jgi:hypothetical protein